MGEDPDSGRKGGGDGGWVAAQLEQIFVAAEVGVEELDEGWEAEPVGDRQPAGVGVLSRRSVSHHGGLRPGLPRHGGSREGQRCSSTGRVSQATVACGG